MVTRRKQAGKVYGTEQNAEINVTPFVDIMLVLLIIFMVSIPVATKAVKMDMPPAGGERTAADPVFISVHGPDALYIGERRTSLAALDADLRAALRSNDPLNERVLVRGDGDIDYNTFMVVLNALKGHGYNRIGLINEDLK